MRVRERRVTHRAKDPRQAPGCVTDIATTFRTHTTAQRTWRRRSGDRHRWHCTVAVYGLLREERHDEAHEGDRVRDEDATTQLRRLLLVFRPARDRIRARRLV